VKRVLGIDYGTKRVGLAISDGLGMTARPLEVVERGAAVERIGELIAEFQVDSVVVGMPTGLGGEEGSSAAGARDFGDELGNATGLPVVYLDERFTSRMAESSLLESGMKRRERRATVDKVAAAIILQDYLDSTSD
jgi:putative Holliday junction resolvase